jgi:hypothetical protein
MFRLIALTLLVAIAPAGLADERGTPNRGRSVSECSQQASERDLMASERDLMASERDLMGRARKDFVSGCVSRYQVMDDERRDRYRDCHARAADRGLHDASCRQYIEDCVTGRLDRRTLTMLGG